MGKVFRNAEYERRVQERLFIRLSKKHETRIRRELADQYTKAANAVERGNRKPKVNDKRLQDSVSAVMRDSFEEQGQRTASALREATGRGRKAKVDMSPAFEAELERYTEIYTGRKVTEVSKTTIDRIRRTIKSGIAEGLSNREMAAQIRQMSKIDSAFRANMIARTESHAAMNAGSTASARDTGVVKEKIWIHATDSRTRDGSDGRFDHTSVANVGMDDPFNVSGEELMFPGDPAGSAGNIVNCRCAVGYVV